MIHIYAALKVKFIPLKGIVGCRYSLGPLGQ